MMKTCSICQDAKPLRAYHKNSRSRDGYRSECGECRKSARSNPVTRSKQAISRMKYNGLSLDIKPIEIAWTLGDKTCDYCGTELEYAATTIDHVVPVSRAGRNTFDNLACACSKCNTTKRDTPVILFMLRECDPYANRKLLERLALRSGRTVPEVYELLIEDVQEYFASRAEAIPSG
jgi:5-methylcytosine-specific restriction endonuclease McrA